MNIQEKTKLAHEHAMNHLLASKGNITTHSLTSFAWQYADEMEKQADARIKQKAIDDAKVSREFMKCLTKDKDGNCKHVHTTLNGDKCFDCGEVLKPKETPHQCNCAHWKNSSFFMGDTFKCNDCGGMVTI